MLTRHGNPQIRKICQCSHATFRHLNPLKFFLELTMNAPSPNVPAVYTTIAQTQPITIAGLAIRTSNSKAFDDIPAHADGAINILVSVA